MKLIFATNNQHKVEEVQAVISDTFELLTLKEAGIDIDIPEPHDTIEANASEKSSTIYQLTGINCFSEDTGLEVTALNGEPGVKSARYAGDERSFDRNIEKLLTNLAGKYDRTARFKTVISLIMDGQKPCLKAYVKALSFQKRDTGIWLRSGFLTCGYAKTFAEML